MLGPTTNRPHGTWTEPARGLRGRGRARGQHRTREQLRQDLRERYWLRLHVAMIALLTLGALWLCSAMLMHAGVESLALRYGLACPVTCRSGAAAVVISPGAAPRAVGMPPAPPMGWAH